MRAAPFLLTLAFAAACAPESGLPPLPTDQVSARFPPGGVVNSIEIDAIDRLPLRTAELVSPDIVVNVPKNQQVANAVISFESDLYGALKNGGSISSPPGASSTIAGRTGNADAEHPIKPMIIGTGNDPQVAAALDFLQKAVRRESGAQHG